MDNGVRGPDPDILIESHGDKSRPGMNPEEKNYDKLIHFTHCFASPKFFLRYR